MKAQSDPRAEPTSMTVPSVIGTAPATTPAPSAGLATNELVISKYPALDQEGRLVESFGFEHDGQFIPFLRAGCKEPCSIGDTWSTATDNQSTLEFELFRGQAGPIEQAVSLGRYQIVGIPPAPRGVPHIRVMLIAKEGTVMLDVKDLGGGKVFVWRTDAR